MDTMQFTKCYVDDTSHAVLDPTFNHQHVGFTIKHAVNSNVGATFKLRDLIKTFTKLVSPQGSSKWKKDIILIHPERYSSKPVNPSGFKCCVGHFENLQNHILIID